MVLDSHSVVGAVELISYISVITEIKNNLVTTHKFVAQFASYEQLVAAFKHGSFDPVYFLFGEEYFLINRLQDIFLESVISPEDRDFNFDLIYGSETDAQSVVSICSGYPMMAERRVVLVRNVDKLSDKAFLTEYVKNPSPTTVLMLVSNTRPNFTQHPFRALKEKATCAELKALRGAQVPGWVNNLAAETGKTVEPKALQMLVDFTGNDLETLSHEINKLVAYSGSRNKITPDDILEVGGHSRSFNVFELQNAVAGGNRERSIEIAEKMLQQTTNVAGESLRILAVLSSFFNRLWILLACKGAKMDPRQTLLKLGFAPNSSFLLREYERSLKYYSYRTVQEAFRILLAADSELKGGSSRNPNLILTLTMRRLVP